ARAAKYPAARRTAGPSRSRHPRTARRPGPSSHRWVGSCARHRPSSLRSPGASEIRGPSIVFSTPNRCPRGRLRENSRISANLLPGLSLPLASVPTDWAVKHTLLDAHVPSTHVWVHLSGTVRTPICWRLASYAEAQEYATIS